MAASTAESITKALRLAQAEAAAIVEAARHHDDGKAHPLWQVALRGSHEGEPLAKSPYFVNPKLLAGMRHELISALMDTLSDLARWLVASHHGRCRPFFPKRSYDPDRIKESAVFNANLPFLFDRLQKAYGYWGLAYLEAVFRGIDIQSEEQA
jgi:CRISPR-associated endonuclease/helicase Cas3